MGEQSSAFPMEPVGHRTTRPLTARSIIASTLLGTHPPRMPAALLVRSCALFGLRENAARVALTRMLAAGEVTVDDSWYELVGRLRDRQRRQDRSRTGLGPDSAWDGTWLLGVVTGEARSAADRAELRRVLAQHRFAEWREGVWARPDNLDGGSALEHRACEFVPGCHPPQPKALAVGLFGVAPWSDRARVLVDDLARTQRALRPGDGRALAEAFVVSADVLRHLQADPLLPTELLPSRWPGERLRQRYEEFDESFQAIWRTHLRR